MDRDRRQIQGANERKIHGLHRLSLQFATNWCIIPTHTKTKHIPTPANEGHKPNSKSLITAGGNPINQFDRPEAIKMLGFIGLVVASAAWLYFSSHPKAVAFREKVRGWFGGND